MNQNTLVAIDADGHLLERRTDIYKYLDKPWKNRTSGLWPGDQPWDPTLNNTLGHPYDYHDGLSPTEQKEKWARILDENAIEKAILFPTGSGNVGKLQEAGFAAAVAKACNRHFAEDYATDRLRPVGVLPMRDPQAAAREIERAKREHGISAFEILTTGTHVALGDPFYDPVFETAQSEKVTLCIHGTRSGGDEVGGGKLRTFSEMHSYAFVAGMLLQFTSILLNGVTKRYPSLKLAFLEVGATWLPYYLDRLDEHWEKRGAIDSPDLDEKPSKAFQKSTIKVSIEAEERLLKETIAIVGAEHLVFASDVPHWDSEFPKNLNELRENTDIPLEVRRKLLSENARELFSLS